MVEYGYDAWGKPTKAWSLTHPSDSTLTSAYAKLAQLNPFRYRGYVWDEETGLYYLRSRYYDPAWGRFLNADKHLGDANGLFCHNIYCYCKNNQIIRYDPDGFWDWKALSLGNYLKGKLVAALVTSDEFGYVIMERWFNGLGEKQAIKNDPKWNQFMLDNDNFKKDITKYAKLAIDNKTFSFEVKNTWLSLDVSSHGEGNYWSGYGLINGSNADYGGFCVNGTVQHIDGNRYKVVADYEFNDYIDPGNYATDWLWAVGSWCVLGVCLNYELQIAGTVEFEFSYG